MSQQLWLPVYNQAFLHWWWWWWAYDIWQLKGAAPAGHLCSNGSSHTQECLGSTNWGQGQDRKLGRAGEEVGSTWRSEVFGYMLCLWHSQKCNKNIILKTSAAHLCASLFLYKKNSFNPHEWQKYYCYFQITWKETNGMKLISDKAVSAQIEWSRLRASGLSASWLEEMEHLAIHVCNISCRQPPALPDFILLLCLSPSSFVHIPHVHLLFS